MGKGRARIPVIVALGASMVFAQFPVGPQAAHAAGPNAIVQLISGERDLCKANVLPANDDGSTAAVSLGFTIDFFGKSYSSAYVNNNGNITFDAALQDYTPFALVGQSRAIVAPFFGDVDTRAAGSSPLTYSYGAATYLGRPAFCVDWVNVGYYDTHADKLNSFQLLLVDRSDIGRGNFDIIFNYDQVQWETGDASLGMNGLGGYSARVGYSNGSTAALEIAGSAVNGALLDGNATGLVKRSRGTDQLGRYIFPVRNGGITLSTGSGATNLVGTTVSFTATVTEADTSVAARPVTLAVSGANTRSLSATTDTGGAVTFSYTGTVDGADTVVASFTDTAGATRSTKPLSLSWVAVDQVAGIAACLTVKIAPAKNPGTITTTLLPNATLTFTPALSVPIPADAAGAYLLRGLTASTAYTVEYSATVPGPLGNRLVTCHTSFTTNASGGAIVPAPSALPNYGNHTWLHPLPLAGAVNDVLTGPFQKTWYKVTVTPHQRVTVTLDHLTRNYTLTAYVNLRMLATNLKNRAATLAGVAAIHSQGDISAGDLDSGDLDSGDLDSGDLDSGDLDSGDLDSGDLDSGDLDSGDLDSGDLDSGDLDSGDLDSGDLDSAAGVYGTAQRLGRRAFSAHGGLAPESITLNTRGYNGDVYFRVAGHSGAYDTGNAFTLTLSGIVPTDASCTGAPLVAAQFTGSAASTVANPTTLILTNTARLGTLLGTPTPGPIAAADRPAFDSALATLAARPEVRGVVADLAAPAFAPTFGPAFAEWDGHAACALEANIVAGAIHGVIDVYRAAYPSIKYLVFAGGHQAVPFFSQVDRAEISREWRFSPPLEGLSAGEAALASGYYLTDDYYTTSAAGTIDRFGHLQFVPELASGRLVESSTDIVTAITSYVTRGGAIAAGGAPSLSAGYTFNSDLATAITAELNAAGQTVDTSLNNDTWSAAQLRSKLLPAASPQQYSVIGLQAHFSANRLVPADNLERVLSTEFANNGIFDGTLIESIGCHLGYNIVDTYGIPTITRTRSFPEILLSRGATLVGNTGYGYADDVLLKSSEDLILKFTHELRYSQDASGNAYSGGTPLGDALRNAKLQYLTMPNQRGIDEKVVAEATIYGLPMSTITLPTRIARDSATPLVTTAVGAVTGLSTYTFDQSFTLIRSALGAGGSSFYSIDGDLTKTVATPLRPIGPALAVDVIAKETSIAGPDTLARGWVILEGDASIVTSFVPRISLPATQDSTPSTANYINRAFTPTRPGALSTLTRPTFQFQPFQYLSNATGSSGTARTYSREQVKLYFSRATDAAALAEAPLVYNVALTDASSGTTHKAHVDVTAGYGAGAGIADLWLTYTTNGGATFRSVPATLGVASLNGSAATCGTSCGSVVHGTADIDTGTALASTLQLFVQEVGNNALVTSATNSGQLYSLAAQNAADVPPLPATTISSVTAPAAATYLSHIGVSATLSAGTTKLAGKPVTFKLGRSRATATTDANGVATASLLVNVAPSAGAQSVTVSFAGDAAYAGSGAASGPVTVSAAPTSLLPSGPLQSGESGPVGTLVLPDHANAPLADQMISLVPGGSETAATYTNGDGVARLDAGDFSAPLAAGLLDVRYDGDPGGRYGASSRTIPIYDPTKAVAAAGSVTSGGQKATFGFALKYLGAPTVTPATGGSLGQGEYRLGYSLASSFAETAIGATARVSVGPNGAIGVAAITGIPSDKVSVRFYFTSAPVGQRTGFVVSRPVSKGSMAAFTITAGPTTGSAAASAPTGGLALRIQNAATGATTGLFAVAGTPGGFDWLVITGSPSSHAVFEGTGSYTTPSTPFTPVRRHFRVVVDKPANTFAITIDAAGALPAITIGGAITPLPLDDEPSASGIVFR